MLDIMRYLIPATTPMTLWGVPPNFKGGDEFTAINIISTYDYYVYEEHMHSVINSVTFEIVPDEALVKLPRNCMYGVYVIPHFTVEKRFILPVGPEGIAG